MSTTMKTNYNMHHYKIL